MTSDQVIHHEELRDRAAALRAEGRSRAQIKEVLGLASDWAVNELLRDAVPPGSRLRANAKDDLRRRARELRVQGRTYKEIEQELGVSRSSVSLWVRDLPRPVRPSSEEGRRRTAEGWRRYWEREQAEREAARKAVVDEAAAEVGPLSDRQVLILGAVAYWCEGTKNKPGRRHERVVFVNSDPGLIKLFLRFVEVAGVAPDDLVFRVMIHESADVEGAPAYWRTVTGADERLFGNPTLKRHNPSTVRHNVGEGYHGCLRVDVRRSAWLYKRIEGWMRGVTAGL
ncbi:hypothetical protein ACFOWE_09190 [Planomonospora corallina]|uniref:Homeodomain-like domain-containing protein n=1 Tax=Planomonospora corallina TaxID=1806052 RepID=A0ABV8I620_9ACTN